MSKNRQISGPPVLISHITTTCYYILFFFTTHADCKKFIKLFFRDFPRKKLNFNVFFFNFHKNDGF